MPVNAATKFAIRTVLREAINKSNKEYKGNVNRKNCRYISTVAERLLSTAPAAPLVADHAVPVSVSLRAFEDLETLSIDSVVALMAKYTTMVLITPDEDNRLTQNGLVKSMPAGWNGEELLARYRAVCIEVKPNPSFRATVSDGG
jgi:hypothetical protein